MSPSREQSYYEIALTNGQVRTIFAVLLISMIAAFLAGVWVGRGETAVVSVVEPAAITAAVEPGEQPLEELDFFSRGTETATQPPATPEKKPAQPRARKPPAPAAEEPKPVIIEEAPSQDEAARSLVQELRGEKAAAPERESAESAPAKSAPPKPAPAKAIPAAAGAGELVVQVFSSTDEAQARRVLERLVGGGYPAVLSPVEVDGTSMYRVRVGPYTDRDEALAVADRVRRAYKLDTWITR